MRPHFPDSRFPRLRRRAAATALIAFAGLLIAMAVAACGGDAGGAAPSPSAPSPGDAVVVRVNGQAVGEVQVRLAEAQARFEGTQADGDAALRTAVDRELVRQEVARLGLTVEQARVDERVTQLVQAHGSEAGLQTALEQAGLSRGDLEVILRNEVTRDVLREAKYSEVKAGGAAARRFYRHRRETLFTQPAALDLGAIAVRSEAIADNAVTRLEEGTAFEEVARQFAFDAETRQTGGRQGWVAPASLPDPLRAVVRKMREGDVSQPTEFLHRWWVLKVFGRREQRVIPYAKVSDDILDLLSRRKREAALSDWLDAARDRATVVLP